MSKAIRQRRGLCPRYTATSRGVYQDGAPILLIRRSDPSILSPSDTDRFVHRITQLLNRDCVSIGIRRGSVHYLEARHRRRR